MPQTIGILGATSLVGKALLLQLSAQDHCVIAFSRRQQASKKTSPNIEWNTIDQIAQWQNKISYWICVAPIWILPDYFQELQACGARRIVALSSTSIFTKENSADNYEQSVVDSLKQGETAVQKWAEEYGIQWCILRPTLIYGYGEDKNISEIARFIQRFGFFPLFGKANGLRQPVHADDVAKACIAILKTTNKFYGAYNITGAETLSYREMVCRIFVALGRKPRILTIPLFAFRMALVGLRLLPRYRHWSVAMAERMNQNLVFDYSDAARDFAYAPLGFQPKEADVSS